MANSDQIPGPDNEFDTLQGIIVTAVTANSATWAIPAPEITKLTDKQNPWAATWLIAKDKQNSTSAQKKAKDLARKNYTKVLRPFIQKWIYRNELVDDAAIEQCGLRPRDATATPTTKPDAPVVTIKRGVPGELIATCAIIPKAKYYGCLMLEGGLLPSDFQISPDGKIIVNTMNNPNPNPQPDTVTGFQFDLTEKRLKHFTGLKPGVTYYFYYYAVNAAGVSPLSAVVSMMCW